MAMVSGSASDDGGAAGQPRRTLDLGSQGGSAQLILSGALDSSAVDAISATVLWSVQVMRAAAEGFGLPFPQLEIWMLDLPEALIAVAPRVKGPPAVPNDFERVGGQVAGKTMPLEDDWSRAAVASPGAVLASDDGRARAIAMFSLLHEIGHVLVERLGTLSGVREIGWNPTVHSRRKAENTVRRGLDEWRVSTMASVALGGVITNAEGSEVGIPALLGATYRDSLGDVLDYAYPGWPDAVTRYRLRQMSLRDMYAQVVGETVDVFTFLSHCEAESMMLGRETPLRDEWAAHPSTRLYLGAPWGALIDCEAPLLAPLAEFADAESTYLSEVAPRVIDMWRRLGLTFTDGQGPDDLRIDVTAPLLDLAVPPDEDSPSPAPGEESGGA
jgi:hypothetical protein